jgi:hypothetical protein
MFTALSPTFTNKPGSLEQDIQYGIRVGYGGPQRHSTGGPGGTATIADIASFHQNGAGRLPQRQIIVPPPSHVITKMGEDMQRAIDKLANNGNG